MNESKDLYQMLIVGVSGDLTPRGNIELINTLRCRIICEQNLSQNKSFDEILDSLKTQGFEFSQIKAAEF